MRILKLKSQNLQNKKMEFCGEKIGILKKISQNSEDKSLKIIEIWNKPNTFLYMTCGPQVRIFMEIHNNLYLKSERRLSPTSVSVPRQDGQRGGGGSSRGRSSLSLHISPLIFNNPMIPGSSDPGSTYQHLPMAPLGSPRCEIHSFTALPSGDSHTFSGVVFNDLRISVSQFFDIL